MNYFGGTAPPSRPAIPTKKPYDPQGDRRVLTVRGFSWS